MASETREEPTTPGISYGCYFAAAEMDGSQSSSGGYDGEEYFLEYCMVEDLDTDYATGGNNDTTNYASCDPTSSNTDNNSSSSSSAAGSKVATMWDKAFYGEHATTAAATKTFVKKQVSEESSGDVHMGAEASAGAAGGAGGARASRAPGPNPVTAVAWAALLPAQEGINGKGPGRDQ